MVIIERYNFGEIVINGKTYTRDLIVFWTSEVWSNWWRKEGHNVCVEDVSDLLRRGGFEIVIFGTGAYGVCRVSEDVINELKKRGVDVIVCNTHDAVQKFNELVKQGKKVVACLHLTC